MVIHLHLAFELTLLMGKLLSADTNTENNLNLEHCTMKGSLGTSTAQLWCSRGISSRLASPKKQLKKLTFLGNRQADKPLQN